MDVEACGVEEGTELFFKLLSEKLKDKTYSNLSKSLDEAKSQISLYVFTQKMLNEDERNELAVCLSWLFCTLLEISADDRAGSFQHKNISLQTEIIVTAYHRQRWWYSKMLNTYTSLLEQAMLYNDKKDFRFEFNIPLKPSQEVIVWSKFELDIPKVIIDSNKELEKVMDCCISVLTHTVPEFCNMKREEGIKTRATIFEVLQNESIHMKTNCLIFFKKYFTSLVMINEVDTKFFIAIIETLSRIYKEIYSWFPEKRNLENLKTLHEAVHKFLESAPIEKFAFDNQLNVQNLIVYASEILYLQTSDAKEMWFDAMLVYSVIVMVKRVLDNFDYSLSSVERLSLLSNTSDSEIIPLMKYLVIAELEQAHNFQLQVAKTSRTWKKISDLLTIKIERLLSFPGDTFELELRTIADVVLLAYQIEFEFTIRHQFKHGMHPNTCMCNSLNSDTPVSPLMKFSGWDYKHINMEMFGDLEKFTQKLLDLVEVNGSIEASGVVCFIDIFSSVLMFSNSIRLLETVKQIFVTIVASPFYKCIKDDPQYKNHVGSSKVMASLPKKLQTYFDTDVPEHHLEQMRIDSILCLSMLEISAIGNPCWTLVENIIQFVTNQDGQKLKETLFSIIPNFIVKNGYKFAQIIDQYQEILNSKNGPIAIKPLQHILCLSGGNVTILKKSSSENHFHFFIVCENCKISTVPCFKEKKLEENLRRMALIKKNKGLLISSDCIKQGKKPLNFNAMKLFSQPDELKMEIYSKIPAVLNHSSQIQESIRADKGKSFFETIFSTNEKVLEKLSANLGDILSNIKSLNFGETTEAQIMNNCFTAFANILKNFAFGTDANQQHLMVSIAFTFVSIVPTEIFFVKCFKIFALFIVQQSSKVMDEASNMAQEMAKQNNITLELLLTWHRTFLMEHIVNMCITNLFQHKTSLLNSLTNFTRRINISRMRDFLPQNLPIIVALSLPKAVLSKKLMMSLEQLCQLNQQELGEVIFCDFIKIYAEIYIEEKGTEALRKCKKFFEASMKMTIRDRLRMNQKKMLEQILVYYSRSPEFVMEAMSTMLETSDPELIASSIDKLLLSVLIYFEQLLASHDCERGLKQNVLLSLGELIRLLGSARISPICFKIITLLKAAVEQTEQDLSKMCIKVWDILIRISNVASLGPILSTIFVSLEVFIDKYPADVNKIFKYLIEDNVSLLSRHISDLFFIKKTRVNNRTKRIVLDMINSQKMNEKEDFRSTLQSLMRHMINENSDLKIRVYCLQFITELFQNSREQLNELICGRMSIDPIIEDLLHILINNCKTTNSVLQLATAECLGELGAIEPSLQHQNYASQKEFPKTIHSKEFAKMALEELCRSYQYKNDSKYTDALSLAIQQILKESNVNLENRGTHEVWLAIPEKMRPLLEPLITSSYIPKQTTPIETRPIFLNCVQTPSEWVILWVETLIAKIPVGGTRLYLESIKPSMKHNQHTTATFLPYILLHCLQLCDLSEQKDIVDEIQFIFDVLMKKDVLEHKKKDRKPLIVKSFDFDPVELKKKKLSGGFNIATVTTKIVKMIFEIFDFLENFRRTSKNSESANNVSQVLDKFDLKEMAQINYNCGEYARALIYLEAQMKLPGEDDQKHLLFLAQIFANLGCSDSIEGVQAMKTSEWSLEDKVLISNITGNYQDVAASCERMMQLGEATFENVQSMVNSFIAKDQPETALLVYEKMVNKCQNSQNKYNDIKAEPLWRLSRFDELDKLLADNDMAKSTSWGVQCGKMLLKFRADDQDFFDELSNTRLALMKNLKISGNDQTAYSKNYKEIINLHLITEFEKVNKALDSIKDGFEVEALDVMEDLIVNLNQRMEFIEKNSAIEEPILGFHRIILNETKNRLDKIFGNERMDRLNQVIDGEISNLWMKSTKLACRNKMFQQAQIYVLNAERYHPKGLFLEKAKLCWSKNDQNGAFKILDLGVKEVLGGLKNPNTLEKEEKGIYLRGKMMIARYHAEAINLEFEANRQLFREAKVEGEKNEKLYLLTADFMDRYYSSKDEGGKVQEMTSVMKTYLNTMLCGNESVFQSMPRFLSIWLDMTADGKLSKNDLASLNKVADVAADKLDSYYFFTALSQIIARICHPVPETFVVLKKILVKCINEHPQQTLWYLMPMLKSTNASRAGKCKEILNGDTLKSAKMQQLIQEFNSLIDKFIKLSSFPIKNNERVLSVKNCLPDLANFLKSKPSRIIIPFQSNLQLIRIRKDQTFKFDDDTVKIYSIRDRVDVMASLQKPRKVTLIGDDGEEYPALFKPNDDCRIDQRFMEFSSVLKEFLHKDPESRRRQLTTRTYCVIPMTENAGLIEWVPNLRPFKEIINSQYKKVGHTVSSMSHLGRMNIEQMSKENQLIHYRKLIQEFYPALGSYFREQFPSPQNFFKARSAYIKSTSVWSIVGYIMGLGDRHGENILIDVCSGETFHVDCNLLFNKGETLNVPETIPFRLTHNMIDAMGVLGIEGPFRKSCEVILRVLQKEKRTLLAYVRPIIYDTQKKSTPEINRRELGRQTNEQMELSNVQKIQRVEMRLNGIVQKYKGSSGIPLSTEGQVNFLIKEATSEENLAAMYRGWLPWM